MVLSRAARAVSSRVHESTNLHDLTLTEFGILEALYHKGPLLLGDVQRKILLSSGGVTYTIDRLVEKGLVERQECEGDKRARFAALTPAGHRLIEEIFPAHAELIEGAMATLSPMEQEELTELLKRLGVAAASNRR